MRHLDLIARVVFGGMFAAVYHAPDGDSSTSGEIASAVASHEAAAAADASPASATPAGDGTTVARREAPAASGDAATDTTTRRETQPGAIPFSDHERVVNGFHEKLDKVAWAKELDRQKVERGLALLAEHERRSKRSSADASAPGPDARDEKGEAFYSPKQAAALVRHEVQLAVAEALAQAEEKYSTRLTPIEQAFAEAREDADLTDQIETGKTWPGFEANLKGIITAIATATRAGRKLSLEQAYIQVVAPVLSASEAEITARAKTAWLKELNDTSAAASDDIRPARHVAASRKKDSEKSTAEMLSEEFNAASQRQAAAR